MTLRIHNTLTRALEDFSPLEPGHVRMYVCGMTVYDLCHLGHARSMVAFDVVQRWLKASGYRVTYVRNITDIDDKIIKRSLENGETVRGLTDRMIDALHQDADALGIERPTHEPRAMDYVPQMLSMIGTLQDKGLAYQASNGDVNYAVRKFPGYGKLSGKSLDELQAGERVAIERLDRLGASINTLPPRLPLSAGKIIRRLIGWCPILRSILIWTRPRRGCVPRCRSHAMVGMIGHCGWMAMG